jgi:hypothetical protein
MLEIEDGNTNSALALIRKYPGEINKTSYKGESPLGLASQMNNTTIVKELIKLKVDPNLRNLVSEGNFWDCSIIYCLPLPSQDTHLFPLRFLQVH